LSLALLAVAVVARAENPQKMLRSNAVNARTPTTMPASKYPSKYLGVQALFFDSVPYQGHATTTFAYLGVPAHTAVDRLPAILPPARWRRDGVRRVGAPVDRSRVRRDRPDLCGSIPVRLEGPKQWRRHAPTSGPGGWDPFPEVKRPVAEQWPYHALADAVVATSLLRSLPEVDPERVGVTGISWGGYVTCMLPALDDRLMFAVPVYGCGFIDRCVWRPNLEKLPPGQRQLWLEEWDPKQYLPAVKVPMLWVDSTNDKNYSLDAQQLSYDLPKSPRTESIVPRMPHNHPAHQSPEIIHVFVNAVLKNGTPLPSVTLAPAEGRTARATFTWPTEMKSAELQYTTDAGPWPARV
jgi:hypothetical protein